jgi:hypothetical protein
MQTISTPALVVAAFALAACGAQRTAAPIPTVASDAPSVHTSFPAPAPTANARHVGDFSVHEISGSFRKHPALLTERVVAREGDDAWIMDYRLEDSDGVKAVRVRMEANGDITRVSRMLDGVEKPGTMADYETLMASASLAPDENQGLTATTKGTCMVGPSELDCETKSYRVLLGDKEASLGITESASLPGHDVSGEITASDGTVIFRSALVEHGNEGSNANDSVAMHLPPL